MAETTTIGNNPEEKTFAPAETPAARTPEAPSGGFSASEEMELNVSPDQLSFICEYCGKVNAISSPSCVRCGKRRPRSEYLNAMNRLKNANSVKSQYIEEQAKLAADRQDAAQAQLVRLVESRVADEKAQIMAQDEIRLEQERDNIKRATARDAVLRVIAAERAADEKVKNAEMRAESAVKERDRVAEESIAAEREQVLYAAAKRVVSERAGIESAAEDRIQAERKHYELKSQEEIDRARLDAEKTLLLARDEAEKSAARRAVLKVVASEQAAADRTRLERDAITRAALDRISEERHLAEINAYSKYRIEKEAMERAVDERIKAERELLNQKREKSIQEEKQKIKQAQKVQQAPCAQATQQPATVQPLAIVPYVNSMQPLYQYNTMKQVYKFVPDPVPQQQPYPPQYPQYQENVKAAPVAAPAKTAAPVATKNTKVMWLSFFTILFGLLLIFVTAMNIKSLDLLKYIVNRRPRNMDIMLGLFMDNRYRVFSSGEKLWFVPSIALLIMFISAIVCVLMGFVSVIKGRTPGSFVIYALIAFLGSVGTAVGLYLIGAYKDIMACFESIGLIIIIIASFLLFIFAIICVSISKKGKKKVQEQPVVEVVKKEVVTCPYIDEQKAAMGEETE